MKSELEAKLADALLNRCYNAQLGRALPIEGVLMGYRGPWPSCRDVISEMINAGEIANAKQAWWTLEKWSQSKWYDYGVALDLGWLTAEGIEHFRKAAASSPKRPPHST